MEERQATQFEKTIKQAARGLRKDQTPAEKLLWEYLRLKQLDGFKFRRQQAIGRFIADFICFEKRLIIELDGAVHLSQKERDGERDYYLNTVILSFAS
jgi:very-short-patch-repair endonuclease